MHKHYLLALLSFSLAAAVAQEKRVTLIFAGDAMQHTPQIVAAKTDSGYNYQPVFKLIEDKIANADIAGVNLETTFGGPPYTGYPLFSSPKEYATALHNAGFNIFFTANNHALDSGKKGLQQTIKAIKDLGAKQTGTFTSKEERLLLYPLMLIKNGIRIAFLNYTYGTNGLKAQKPNIVNLIDTITIKQDIVATKKLQPDIIIAVMHWGEEYHTQPSAQQKSIAQFLFNNNVRIIIGHHPHVVQPIQTFTQNDSITHTVFYSLGNFVSNQRKPNRDGGMLAEIVLSKTSNNAPVTIQSVDYSLVWTHKYFVGGKPVYRILPVSKDSTNQTTTYTDSYNLQPGEQWAMSSFVKSAIKTVERGL